MKTDWPVHVPPPQREAIEEFVRRLYATYNGRIVLTALFGSVARGDFTPDSDVDMLVVADEISTEFKWSVWTIGSRVSLDYDVILNVHIKSRARWEAMRAAGEALWRNIEREGVELISPLYHQV
jgi:predicted nucleotidyltransferase